MDPNLLPNELREALKNSVPLNCSFNIAIDKVIDSEKRLVRVSFSSDAPLFHGWGNLILSHEQGEYNLERLNDSGAFLDMHVWENQVGAFVPGSVEVGSYTDPKTKKSLKVGRGVVKISRNENGENLLRDMLDGIRVHTSIGFSLQNATITLIEEKDGVGTYRATGWEALEVSSVSIPRDTAVGVGRARVEEVKPPEVVNNKPEVPATAEPKVEVVNEASSERSRTMNPEELKKQQEEIRSTAKKVGTSEAYDLAMEAVQNSWTSDEFKARLYEASLKASGAKPVTVKPEVGMSRKDLDGYSITRAIRTMAEGGKLDGLEGEMSAEVARRSNMSPSGFFIPYDVLRAPLRRDLTVGTLSEGGYLVDTKMMPMIDLLRNKAKVLRMGANFISGLVGDIAFPRLASGTTSYWLSENGTVTESAAAFGQVIMKPKRLGTTVDISKMLVMQTSMDVEALIRADIASSQALAIDLAALNGKGATNEPLGIMKTTGVGSVAMGTNGGAPTWAKIVEFETTASVANADEGTLGFLTNPKVRGKCKTVEKASNTARFLWEDAMLGDGPGDGRMNGYIARASNQVPSNLVKGSSGAVCSAAVFGDWSSLMVGQWAGLDVVVDPLTKAKQFCIVLTVNQFVDTALRHPESFVVCQDILTT